MELNTSTLITNYKKFIFDNLWESSIVGLAIVESNGQYKAANPSFCNLVEYNLLELQGKKYQDITHPDDVESDVGMADKLYRGEQLTYTMKKRFLTKTGKVVWVLLKVTAIRNDDDEFLFFLSQVSELLDIQSATINDSYEDIYIKRKKKTIIRKIKENWEFISFGLMILGGLIYWIWNASKI